MVFEKLTPELGKIVAKKFKNPTLPQQMAIPSVLDNKNILLLAKTSTGKTESAVLPVFSKIMANKDKPISALYVTPLKSLNRDLLDRMMWWGQETGLEVSVRHGDTTQYERKMQLEFPPHMLITTLETLQPILTGKRFRGNLENIKYVILDEVHEMVDSKRGVQLTVALERLKELCGDFQLIMLSATVGDPKVVSKFFAGGRDVEILKADTTKKVEIDVINPNIASGDERIAENIFTSPDTASRVRTIIDLIKESRSSIVFTNTRSFAEVLGSRIKTLDKTLPVEIHHGSLSKNVRIKAEKEFKDEKLKALISTSSLQLGIDIGSVDLVLQYMSPRRVSQLTQRIGRAGHEHSKVSKGIIITTDEDDVFESAVIARRAMNQEFEQFALHNKPYDVLAHQIIGMTLDMGGIEPEKAYNIVKRAYPYRNLTYKEFNEVCTQLAKLGLIFFDRTVNKKRRGFDYYFTQLSTIPTIKNYTVFNIYDKSYVGVLDEGFIAVNGEVGKTFILKSDAYKIISIEDKKVMVEPVTDIEAAIPGWEGELIPIPYSIAQEVGTLRGTIAKQIDKKKDSQIRKQLMEDYPIDENCAKMMLNVIKKQNKFGVVPDEKTMLIEDHDNFIVIHSPFGIKVNDTLGRFFSSLITSRIGSVGLKTDAYRIIIDMQKKNLDLIKEVIMETDVKHFKSYLEMSLSRSDLFDWKFIQVAKRFGAFTKEAEFGKIRMKKIVEDYAGTPVYEETLKEIETEKLDLERAHKILKDIQSKEIKLVFKKGLSPLGRIGLHHKYSEIIGPEKPESEIFDLFKKRLLGTQVRLICVNCGNWSQTYFAKDVKDSVKCGKCTSRLLAPVYSKTFDYDELAKKAMKKADLGADGSKKWDQMKQKADLFMVYKSKAAIALSARGVGAATAKRILAKWYKDNDAFLKAILNAERTFVKNKQFWAA